MINLDSVLKSRDITLPIKICIVKAVVFPEVTQLLRSKADAGTQESCLPV